MARRSASPPGEFDLDAILSDGKRPAAPRPGARTTLLLAAVAVLGLAVVASAVVRLMSRDAPPNLAPNLGLDGSLTELNDVDGDWIGVVSPDWSAALDPTEAQRRCPELARSAGVPPGEVLSLMTASGQPLASCESSGAR